MPVSDLDLLGRGVLLKTDGREGNDRILVWRGIEEIGRGKTYRDVLRQGQDMSVCDTGRQPEGWTGKACFAPAGSGACLAPELWLVPSRYRLQTSSGAVFFMIDFRIFAQEKKPLGAGEPPPGSQ